MTRAKITRISEGKVFARTVNSFGESAERGWWPNDGRHGTFEDYKRSWNANESQCRELELHPDSYYIYHDKLGTYFYYDAIGNDKNNMRIFEGDEINVIEDNKFKIA